MIVDLQLAPTRTEEPDVEIVEDLDVLSESNRCNCNASDDNPY